MSALSSWSPRERRERYACLLSSKSGPRPKPVAKCPMLEEVLHTHLCAAVALSSYHPGKKTEESSYSNRKYLLNRPYLQFLHI